MMKAIIGLGNPGPRYARTRHNAGFWIVDQLADQFEVKLNRKKANSEIAVVTIGDVRVLLAKPQTYMNESGLAVRDLARAYGLNPEDHLICYDDLDTDCGRIRLRSKGGAGGHNGMRSIIQYVGTQDFPRLRLGIGSVPPGVEGARYVLGKPAPKEYERLHEGVLKSVEAALLWVEKGIDFAMSRSNSPGPS